MKRDMMSAIIVEADSLRHVDHFEDMVLAIAVDARGFCEESEIDFNDRRRLGLCKRNCETGSF